MAVNYADISEKVFNLLKGYGYALSLFDSNGKKVLDPTEATWYAVADPNIVVKINSGKDEISLSANKKTDIEQLRTSLKRLAQKYLMTFDYKTFDGKLSPKSEEIFVAQSQEKDMADVMEGFGTMTGSTKTSYQPLDNVKIVVKHKHAVNEETRGARSRNIHSIYIQRGEERFKMTENNLKAARAMARHVNMGGEMFDSVGSAISEMATEQRRLSEFVRYVTRKGLVNETNERFVSIAKENVKDIKETLDKICGVKSYANAVENLQNMNNVEILEDDVDLEQQFTETHFDSRVSDAMESIKRSISRRKGYEAKITSAIQTETFADLKNMLSETDMMNFESPHARLGHQVNQLGHAAQNDTLKNHLYGISKKLTDGKSLGQFEYSTIKSCLLSASEAKVPPSGMYESAQSDYCAYLESFDIL